MWDPVTRKATSAGSMIGDRWRGETLTRLPDGRVLLVGGEDHASDDLRGLASAEVWNPATDTFARAGVLVDARTGHTATLLADGRVLIVGGTTAADGGHTLATAELGSRHDDLRTRGEDGVARRATRRRCSRTGGSWSPVARTTARCWRPPRCRIR